jgi:sigma-B regulation protein RsbU (phosphoserine phosphatase)
MAFSRSIIRTIAMNGGNPAAVLEQTNRLIVQDNRSGIFLTAFYAILELDTGRLVYASGGHNWPLWLPQGQQEVRELAAEGFLLGAFNPITLQEQAVQLAMDDTLVFFTDGVTEAMNAQTELFGDDRLQATAVTKTAGGAEAVLQSIVTGVKQFTQNTPQSDDFTLFVVKRVKA